MGIHDEIGNLSHKRQFDTTVREQRLVRGDTYDAAFVERHIFLVDDATNNAFLAVPTTHHLSSSKATSHNQ